MNAANDNPRGARAWIARGYTIVEDIVYVGLGALLAATVLALLIGSFVAFGKTLASWTFSTGMIGLLDEVLLILLIVELLYTVQVSFRAHAVVAEPFLLVGLISAIRRVLVLTAQLGEHKGEVPTPFIYELAVLAALILALAISLVILRRKGSGAVAERG